MECDSESISVKYVQPISHSNMFNWTKLRTGHTNVVKTNKKVIVNKSDPKKIFKLQTLWNKNTCKFKNCT